MGQFCDEDLMDMLLFDPRVRGLSLTARCIFIELVQAIRAIGGSALRYGSVVPDRHEIARLVASPLSDVEASLAAIVARGLFEYAPDGSLVCPMLAAADTDDAACDGLPADEARFPLAACDDAVDAGDVIGLTRSEINSRNARAGWAKRKRGGGDDGQRELPVMGVVGGTDHAGGCKPDANDANRIFASDLKLKSLSTTKQVSDLSSLAMLTKADDSDFFRITRVANGVAGLDLDRVQDIGMVRTMLRAGAAESLIVAVIRQSAAEGNFGSHLGYYGPAIFQALLRQSGVCRQGPAEPLLTIEEARARAA